MEQEFKLDLGALPKARKLLFEIESTRPLLMNPYISNDKEFSKLEISGNLTSKQCAEHRLVKSEGKIGIPSAWIQRGIEQAAANFTIEGKGKKSYKDIARGYITIEEDNIPLNTSKWVVNSCAVVIKATKGRIPRHRPEIQSYKTKFTMVIKDRLVNLQKIIDIVQYLGDRIGIGDNRPKYGLFKVISVKEVT